MTGEIFVRIEGLQPQYFVDYTSSDPQMSRTQFTFDVWVWKSTVTWEEAVEAFGKQTLFKLVPVEEDEAP